MLGAAPLKATRTNHIFVLRRLNDELSQIESSLDIEVCQERTPASSEEAAWLNHCHINRFHTSNVVHFQISLSLSVSFSTLHLVHHAAIMLELPGLPSESEWVTVMIRNLPNNYGRNDVPC
jgi:hypothetical protein